jgi:hypothetical protein
MSFTKTYFLCPTSDFIHPPPAGPLCLGSIIRSTSTPQYPLNKASIIALPEHELKPIIETDWKKTISTEKGLGLGVYAQFLQLATGGLPLGTEGSVEHSSQTTSAFAFDTLTTLAFEPTQEYVEQSIQAPAVQTWLREPRQRFKPVVSLFLVTGIKVVQGARIRYSTSQSTKIAGNIGIDVTALGTTVGPKGHWDSVDEDTTEFNRNSEFVFAFRVKRLKVGRRLNTEDYNKGAFLADGGQPENDLSVIVEDLDGSEFSHAKAVHDLTENGPVYCIPA